MSSRRETWTRWACGITAWPVGVAGGCAERTWRVAAVFAKRLFCYVSLELEKLFCCVSQELDKKSQRGGRALRFRGAAWPVGVAGGWAERTWRVGVFSPVSANRIWEKKPWPGRAHQFRVGNMAGRGRRRVCRADVAGRPSLRQQEDFFVFPAQANLGKKPARAARTSFASGTWPVGVADGFPPRRLYSC